MTTNRNTDDKKTQDSNSKKGFASMPKDKVREIASKGGHSSHGGRNTETGSRSTNERSSSSNQEHGKQGFASMPKEKVQEIASKGGKASHCVFRSL